MKHTVFRLLLRTLRKIAKLKQIGNPAGRVPIMISEPEPDNKIFEMSLEREVCVWRFKNVICSGLYGGAVIGEKNQVYSRFLAFPWGKELHPSLFSPYLGRSIMSIDKAIMLITPAPSTNYYHWIADVLPRLLLIKQSNLTDFDKRKIILHKKEKRYENETFTLLGVDTDKVVRVSPFETVQTNDLIVSDFVVSFSPNPFPAWKKHLLSKFKNEIIDGNKSDLTKKIYCVRGKQRTRCLIGEERLITILREEGFFILDPQDKSLKEQVNYLASAELVVALHGAALTNIIFCAEQTKIVELRSTHLPQEYFSEIAKTFNLQFETIEIAPVRKRNAENLANEENLILTDSCVNELLVKLRSYTKQFEIFID